MERAPSQVLRCEVSSSVQEQYEKWPYPSVPTVASVPREHLWQIHVNWIRSRCGLAPIKTPPKIWIAGCGTFEPYIFSLANPEAKILASDISEHSLKSAQKRLRWHHIKNTKLSQINLNNFNEYPDETFDFIECYGVLMCLPDPLATLKNLSQKLKADGILRIMVYPHYSRQRVFQIQNLAKLLGLTYSNQNHPTLLRNILKRLPKDHPLYYGFNSYWDAKNLPGIVDGFLHASDRGFTGFELCALLDDAELSPKFCFHRPWGQPGLMSEKLSQLGEYPFAFWLHYLDLWQSLRTNFTLCVTKKELEQTSEFETQRHPLFNLRNPHLGLSYKTKLLKMAVTGARLPSRTSDEQLNLKSKVVKNILLGKSDSSAVGSEILLNPHLEIWDASFDKRFKNLKPKNHFKLRAGKKILNPLYDYLFDAYTFKEEFDSVSERPFADLNSQINLWNEEAYPLENETIPFGLTPFGTYKHSAQEIDSYRSYYLQEPEISFSDFSLPNEFKAFKDVYSFLKSNGISKLPADSEASLRRLWVLLFSYKQLFIS